MQMASAPRAVIHKQILNVAASNPSAAMEEIAAEVSGATVSLVDRVLNEYGDPADDLSKQDANNENEPMAKTDTTQDRQEITSTNYESSPNISDLTDAQLETLRAIYAFPDASQRELAELLNVSSATISQRVNSIDGFDWKERQKFAEAVIATGDFEQDLHRRVEQLSFRLEDLKQQVNDRERVSPTDSILNDPDFVQKIVQDCLKDDSITDDKEVQLTIDVPGSDEPMRVRLSRT